MALVLVAVSLPATLARAQSGLIGEAPFVTVQGEASADVVPDTAQLSLGVVTDRSSATAATADVAKAAQAIVEQVKADGIDDKDVVTTSIALAPIYPSEPSSNSNPARVARSFRASTDLLIMVRPADRAGAVASHLVDKGANTIEGIAYSSSQEAKILDDLRGEAMRDARRKAQIYVDALGLKLGRVLEIAPSNGGFAAPSMMQAKVAMAAPTPPLPVKPGALTLRADVTARWEIAQ